MEKLSFFDIALAILLAVTLVVTFIIQNKVEKLEHSQSEMEQAVTWVCK